MQEHKKKTKKGHKCCVLFSSLPFSCRVTPSSCPCAVPWPIRAICVGGKGISCHISTVSAPFSRSQVVARGHQQGTGMHEMYSLPLCQYAFETMIMKLNQTILTWCNYTSVALWFLAPRGKKNETFLNLVAPLGLIKDDWTFAPMEIKYILFMFFFFIYMFAFLSQQLLYIFLWLFFLLGHPLFIHQRLSGCLPVLVSTTLTLYYLTWGSCWWMRTGFFFLTLLYSSERRLQFLPWWLAPILQNWKYSTSLLQTEHSWNRYVIHNEDRDFIYSYIHSLI